MNHRFGLAFAAGLFLVVYAGARLARSDDLGRAPPGVVPANATPVAASATAPASTPGMATPRPDADMAARIVFKAALCEARKQGAGGAVAVVDAGGHLLLAERLDGTFPNAARISMGKARTAALFQRPTKVFEDLVNGGRVSMTALEDFTPLQGGHPFRVDGKVVGAVGVSGAASAAADEAIAVAGVKGLEAAPLACCEVAGGGETIHLRSEEVAKAFAKGAPLLEVPGYKVHASRREGPGMAEVHLRDTDIIYVVDGSAKLVTGGKAVAGAPLEGDEEELRGKAIEDGVARDISKGDVIVVPAGVPHWFQEVQAPMTYYVVKVVASRGGCS